jgi:hypothetical protein
MSNIVAVGVVRYNETSGEIMDPEKRCGSTLTYAYFVSFIFLCRYSGHQSIGWKDGNYQPIGWEHGSYQSQSDRGMVITVHIRFSASCGYLFHELLKPSGKDL